MVRMTHAVSALLMLFVMATGTAVSQPISTESFFRFNAIDNIRISPDGQHLAIVSASQDSGYLRIANIDSGEIVASFVTRSGYGVADFHWANNQRIVFSTHERFGGLDAPLLRGEIFGLNIDNTRKFQLVGPGVGDFAAFFIENLVPDQGGRIRVTRYEVNRSSIARSRPTSYLLDINNPPPASRSALMQNLMASVNSPLPWGSLYSDHEGQVRLAVAVNEQRHVELRYRDRGSSWEDISSRFRSIDETGSFRFVNFARDNASFYFLQLSEHGTQGLYQYFVQDGSVVELFVHPEFDIRADELVWSSTADQVIGVKFSAYVAEIHYFADHPDVALHQGLDAAFPGELVRVTSHSEDGNRVIVGVFGPQRVGDYFLLDTQSRQMVSLGSVNEALSPERMAPVTPFALRSPDDFVMNGYLTKPDDAQQALPMVVIPHGGPIGVQDEYLFNREAQFFAHHGYAVLQVNFRGSGGFGYDYMRRGYGQWGTGMIDDIHLAVSWAIQNGHADPQRICVYGGSYGAFAALASVARFPDTYRCAAGYAGVYDLEMMTASDIPFQPGGMLYLDEAVGTDADELRRQSPVNLAQNIRAPVFLVHGGRDRRAPPVQAEAMRQALQATGNEPLWMFQRNEGHGFYNMENRTEFYDQLLAFIKQHAPP